MNPSVQGSAAKEETVREVLNLSKDASGELSKEEFFFGPPPLTKETNDFFAGDTLRSRVFLDKYALRDKSGRVVEKTPLEMWSRVARELASVEKTEALKAEWQEKFYWLLSDFRYIPGGRILFGAGNPRNVTLLTAT